MTDALICRFHLTNLKRIPETRNEVRVEWNFPVKHLMMIENSSNISVSTDSCFAGIVVRTVTRASTYHSVQKVTSVLQSSFPSVPINFYKRIYPELLLMTSLSPLTSYRRVSLWSKSSAVATSELKVKENVSLPTIEVTVPLRDKLLCSTPSLNLWLCCLFGCFIQKYFA